MPHFDLTIFVVNFGILSWRLLYFLMWDWHFLWMCWWALKYFECIIVILNFRVLNFRSVVFLRENKSRNDLFWWDIYFVKDLPIKFWFNFFFPLIIIFFHSDLLNRLFHVCTCYLHLGNVLYQHFFYFIPFFDFIIFYCVSVYAIFQLFFELFMITEGER